jgi:hypothetical protein
MPLTKVSAGVIAANAVVDSFGTQSITGDKIATGQITGNLLTANCVSGNNIVSSPTITGNVTINGSLGIGGATTPSSGVGIKFPGTQVASTDANTLDDYEEGTWTPTITAYAGSVTAYTSQGSYVKIGRIVFATVYAVVSNAGTASGAYVISNLPFSLATSAEVYGYGVNLLTNVGLVAYGSGSTSLYCFTAAGAFPGGSGTYIPLNFNYSI